MRHFRPRVFGLIAVLCLSSSAHGSVHAAPGRQIPDNQQSQQHSGRTAVVRSDPIVAVQPRGSFWETPLQRQLRRLQEDCNDDMNMMGITCAPTSVPTSAPSKAPTAFPSFAPTLSGAPSVSPTRTFSPTEQPTEAPSERPSTSFAPSDAPTGRPSAFPSASPSVSPTDQPSVSPSMGPTDEPSVSPSDFPSSSPTASPTEVPSVSPSEAPTSSPSVSPTDKPTHVPSSNPTFRPTTPVPTVSQQPSSSMLPSVSPSVSQMPSLDPFGVDVMVGLDENEDRAVTATCRPELPSDAESVTEQLIEFQYVLNVVNGTIIPLILAQVEDDISSGLVDALMDCRYTPGEDFYLYRMDSSPRDRTVAGCRLDEQVFGATCFTVAGQLTTLYFYLDEEDANEGRRRRRLDGSSRIGGRSRELQTNTPLEDQIADPNVAAAFAKALSDILNRTDIGGPNVVGTGFVGITNETPPPPPKPENRTPKIVGGVFGAIVGAALVGTLLVFLLKRYNEESTNQYYQEAMDAVDSELDDTLPAELQPRSSYLVRDDDDDISGPGPMPFFSTGSDNESRAVEFIGTADPNAAPPTPVERVHMMEDTRRELGPQAYEATISRKFGSPNTVDL